MPRPVGGGGLAGFRRRLSQNVNFIRRTEAELSAVAARVRAGRKTWWHLASAVLGEATDQQLNLLLECIHFVLCGIVPIRKNTLARLRRTGRLPAIEAAGLGQSDNEGLTTLLRGERGTKVAALRASGRGLLVILGVFFGD